MEAPRANEKRERNEQIWTARATGKTLVEIAKQYGLSVHRIRAICVRQEQRLQKPSDLRIPS